MTNNDEKQELLRQIRQEIDEILLSNQFDEDQKVAILRKALSLIESEGLNEALHCRQSKQ